MKKINYKLNYIEKMCMFIALRVNQNKFVGGDFYILLETFLFCLIVVNYTLFNALLIYL